MFLLDTNVVSELRKVKSGKANPHFVAWFVRHCHEPQFLSAATVLELEVGVLLMERRDPSQGIALRRWMNEHVIAGFAGRILAMDAQVSLHCAPLHVPDPRPEIDAMIAATALVHGMTVVTRNVSDFEPMGVPVLNPWQA